MICNWRVDSVPGSPAYNMAVDTELLAELAGGHALVPTIRVYQWDRDAVSYGRLQSEEAVRAYYPGLPLVRRPTGGRAVRHGNDLTISIVILLDQLPGSGANTVLSSYRQLTAPLAAALRDAGHVAVGYGTQKISGRESSVDCFETSAGCDLVDLTTNRKLAGCAQRREGMALLQQMSVPLRLSADRDHLIAGLQQEYMRSLEIHCWNLIDL